MYFIIVDYIRKLKAQNSTHIRLNHNLLCDLMGGITATNVNTCKGCYVDYMLVS